MLLECSDSQESHSTQCPIDQTSCRETSSYSFCALTRLQNGKRERMLALFHAGRLGDEEFETRM